MQSYGSARRLFGFLEALAWLAVIGGVIVAIIGAGAASELARFRGAGGIGVVLGALPGAAISVTGFIAMAIVQNSRAAVDTAELTGQMLKVARDQLEVSKQSQRHAHAVQQGFEALREQQTARGAVDFGELATRRSEAQTAAISAGQIGSEGPLRASGVGSPDATPMLEDQTTIAMPFTFADRPDSRNLTTTEVSRPAAGV